MGNPFLDVFCTGFVLLDAVRGFPVEYTSVNSGEPNPLWLSNYFIIAIGFLVTITAVVFGCVCCRNGKGFKEFSNSNASLATTRTEGFVNPTANAELTIFPPVGVDPTQICRFEPLPVIKTQAPNLRPAAFSCSDREISSQDWFSEPHNNFPRNQLKYVEEYGRGWFGRVVEGEAQNIVPKEKLTKVMVKILHEDATPTDQMYFLHEVKFYKDLKHPNILRLLGRCLETEPFLIILECYSNGDLKTFLTQNMASARALVEQGVILQMCSNITSGLEYMHHNKFIHTDLAARNCLVGPDLTVKIGDYGNSIENYKSDYYCAGSVALPIRWCAPETLRCTDVTIETREVTPPANIWSLGIVFWEISEFCKLPYSELNDDQVIVRVLGDKNYFLKIPSMFCLYKDEMYHLMKLCWKPPVQRPTASQLLLIFGNLISCGTFGGNSKRFPQDFDQRWQNLKPNNIPKMDNAVDTDHQGLGCMGISAQLKNCKVVDSSLVDSPLGVFMANKKSGHESPRFCLKSDKFTSDKDLDNVPAEIKKPVTHVRCSDDVNSSVSGLTECKSDFETDTRIRVPHALNINENFQNCGEEVDSWLKGVEINNEEDESFVRKISAAIRDLDATLELEKTSSSEEESGKSSQQNSPMKENTESGVDFKLGGDVSSFMNFTQKSFELSSLQNSEQPQSLDFTVSLVNEGKKAFVNAANNMILPALQGSANNYTFDESLKEGDSLVERQSRNSSDTDDEVWRKRIEKGYISEKVKEKSRSIANLMILTHIDASDDDSDTDCEKHWEKNLRRSSSSRRKSTPMSNIFGSENDITHAVLEDDFKESLKKLSNDHKEYGRFDSLGMILPTLAGRKNVWENMLKNSDSEMTITDAWTRCTMAKTHGHGIAKENDNTPGIFCIENKAEQETKSNHLFFLGINAFSENKTDSNETMGESSGSDKVKGEKSLEPQNSIKEWNSLVQLNLKCDKLNNTGSSNSSKKNSSHLNEYEIQGNVVKDCDMVDLGKALEILEKPFFDSRKCNNAENSQDDFISKESARENYVAVTDSTSNDTKEKRIIESIPEITVSEAEEGTEVAEEEIRATVDGMRPFKFILGDKDSITESRNKKESQTFTATENCKIENNTIKPFKFVFKEEKFSNVKLLSGSETNIKSAEGSSESNEVGVHHRENINSKNDRNTVILGPSEEYTLEFFKGLKTTTDAVNVDKNTRGNQKIENEDNTFWSEHLQEALIQQVSEKDFEDISFGNGDTSCQSSKNTSTSLAHVIETINDFIESEKLYSTKVSMLIDLHKISNEEEYDNFKLRTPDDERSSDSGFRDKGSLSESVEDACEGKYNLEDIEAELEDAYVKGAFNNCDNEKEEADPSGNAKSSNNFEYEETTFYVDEAKNEDEFSDIDGEIEFWQNKEGLDYYPEISEFSPTCSSGWYLHPPDESSLTYSRNMNEDIVNAIRNELRENLPIQTRSLSDFPDNEYESPFDKSKRELNIHYASDFSVPLSPIIEEYVPISCQSTKRVVKNSEVYGSASNKARKNMVNLLESVKSIDTNTFMQYLDYMVENEGKDLDDIDEERYDEQINGMSNENNLNAHIPNSFIGNITDSKPMDDAQERNFNSEKNSSITGMKASESGVTKEPNSSCPRVAIEETAAVTCGFTKTEYSFLEDEKVNGNCFDGSNESAAELDDQVLSPEILSPEREGSLSDISRSSNGTRTGDALSEITLSSPDLVPDCFFTCIQEPCDQRHDEGIGVFSGTDTQNRDRPTDSEDTRLKNDLFLTNGTVIATPEDPPLQVDTDPENLKEKDITRAANNECGTVEESDLYEMSTSFMGEDYDEDDGEEEVSAADKKKVGESLDEKSKESLADDSYTGDWDSDFSFQQVEDEDGEESSSSSSGEFIWKDGDKISELRVVHVTGSERKNREFDASETDSPTIGTSELENQNVKNVIEEGSDVKGEEGDHHDDEDDNDSSTGSSASITDFIPSAWNSQLLPGKSVLRRSHQNVELIQKKKNVWFKKQKYHCVYEYPREPSDNEEIESFSQFGYDKNSLENPNKHFTFGVDLSNRHFSYGLPNVVDYSFCNEWDIVEVDDGDLSLTDTDSDTGLGKSPGNAAKDTDFSFYNLSPFDYDFNRTGNESEFFVSSSSRPFQSGSPYQVLTESNQSGTTLDSLEELKSSDKNESTESDDASDSRDFTTPDSGLEDSANASPLDKKSGLNPEGFLLEVETVSDSSGGVLNILDNLKFNFSTEIVEEPRKGIKKKFDSVGFRECEKNTENDLGSPLSSGLGELRHARDKLKLDLPFNHNAELGAIINKKVNNIH